MRRLRVVPHFSSRIVEGTKRERDFHARSRFARSTILEEKWGTTRSLDDAGLYRFIPDSNTITQQ